MIKPAHLVEALPPPVLVVGCHRSGTTVVTQLLRDAGIFVGGDLDANLESRFFIEQNSFILRACGGSWDWPEAVPSLLNDESLTSGMQAYLQRALTRRERKRVAAPSDSSGAWGWKDPRTTLLLPLWLRIFPDARVIWITRHGVDVAQSLGQRSLAYRGDAALAAFAEKHSARLAQYGY